MENMDNLIYLLKNVHILQNENYFEECIDKLSKLNTRGNDDGNDDNYDEVYEPSQLEWECLSENFSKLKYIDELINFYFIPCEEKFKSLLHKFLRDLDKKNQYYLDEIYWEEEEDQNSALRIEEVLSTSLYEKCPYTKLKLIIEGYGLLVNMVEETHGEKHDPVVRDPEFLQTFKKQRLN